LLSLRSYVKDKEAYQTSLTLMASFAKHARAELLGVADAAAAPPQPSDAAPPADGDADAAAASGDGGDVAMADAGDDAPPPAGPDAIAAAAALAAAAAVPRYVAPAPKAALFVAAVTRFYDTASAALEAEHAALAAAERDAARSIESRGELSEAAQAAYDRTRKAFEALLRGVSALAEALGREPPAFPEDAGVTRMAATPGELGRGAAPTPGSEDGPFEDDEARSFYESLPELRAMVPAVLLGGASCDAPPAPADGEAASSEPAAEVASEPPVPAEAPTAGASDADDRAAGGAALATLLARLPCCATRESCDALALDFCYLNSRGARRRLVRELLAAPRMELQLLPYYARLAATLAPVTPRDVAPPLVAALEDEAAFMRAKRDGSGAAPVESRLRCARYLAELTKFRLAPPGSVLTWLKACLDDFAGFNVDTAAALLEGCGRFLARSPESAVRANALIDVLGRLKQARNLDARQAALVDSAYLACRPPPRAPPRRAKERPPAHAFTRHVIFTQLAPASVERCVRLLRRMAWSAENEAYLLKTALKVHKLRFSAVPAVAALLAGLARFHDSLAVAAVDELLEALRCGLEANSLAAQQRRVAHARLLGELYNYRLLTSDGVFGALYRILAHGYEALADGEAHPACDPPGDCSRVRLVVTVLTACGQYFDRGAPGAKLDRFLAYFQRYMLAKPALPLDQAFDVADLFAALRPRLKRHKTFEDACAEVAALEAAEARAEQAAAAAGAPPAVPEEAEAEDEDEEESDHDEDDSSADEESGDDAEAAAAAAEGGDVFDADEMEEEEDEDEGDEEDADEAESEDEAAAGGALGTAGSLVPKDEADAFERELAGFLGSDGGGALGLGGAGKGGIGLRPLSKGGAMPMMSLSSPAQPAAASAGGGATVSFKMLTRRDGRASTRELRVPVASEMATVVAAQQEAEEAERSELKRLVLDQVALAEGAAAAADALAHPPGRVLFSTGGARGAGGDRYRRRQRPT
jgi:regulator of nonsense transcripts 2